MRTCVSLTDRDTSAVVKHDCDMCVCGGSGGRRVWRLSTNVLFPPFSPTSIPWTAIPPVDQQMAASPYQAAAQSLTAWVAFTVKTLPYMTLCRFIRGVTITTTSGCRRICLTTSPISHLGSAPPLQGLILSFLFLFLFLF